MAASNKHDCFKLTIRKPKAREPVAKALRHLSAPRDAAAVAAAAYVHLALALEALCFGSLASDVD